MSHSKQEVSITDSLSVNDSETAGIVWSVSKYSLNICQRKMATQCAYAVRLRFKCLPTVILYKRETTELLSIETVGKIWEMLHFSTCNVIVISSMRVDNWKGEGKHCPVTCQASTEERLKYRSNHTRPWWQKGVNGKPHAPAFLPWERDPVPLVQEAGGPWGWPGWIWKISHTLWFKP